MVTPQFDITRGSVAERVSVGLAKIGMALKARAWRAAGPTRLTPTQGQALATLRGRGTLRLDALAAELGVTAPTASDAVAALVAKGLVARRRAPSDGRAVALSLTAAGEAAADAVADWPDFLVRALGQLDEAEQTAFLRSLTKLIRGLQEAGDIPVQRMCVGCTYFQPNVHAGDRPHHCDLVDAAFGDRHLRFECADHRPATPHDASATWRRWADPLPTGDLT